MTKSKYKIPQQRVVLETKYLFPLAKGPSISAFEYNDPGIVVAFPYEEARPHAPIGQSELKKQSPFLLRYYQKYKKQLEGQTAYSDSIRGEGEFYGVARTGPYSFNSCYVAFRDNTNWCAAVITTKKMPWGDTKRYLFQNHAVSICEREDGKIIDETEAHFVAGIFNTEIVGHFIYASSDNRSFKIRPPVHVPIFDRKNAKHKEIARLSKLAAREPKNRLKYQAEIEPLYIEMCAKR